MSWNPVPANNLPLVLAGPILRKVTKSQVSVWMILKNNVNVSLDVYPEGSDTAIISSPFVSPYKLGNNLFVVCVTAGVAGSNVLDSSTTYGYNVFFEGVGFFNTAGVLDPPTPHTGPTGIEVITYPTSPLFGNHGKLPSFILPAYLLEDVRVLHGSCRKPHGEGYDAMTMIDQVISETIGNPFGSSTHGRPQMLFLSGDQIYSDDVADPLLHMITKYTATLFGWSEILPNTTNSDNLKPGNRHKYIIDDLGIPTDSETSKSHLMAFSEFILMYVMSWSPALWSSGIPDFLDVFPNGDEFSELESIYNWVQPIIFPATPLPANTLTSEAENFITEKERLNRFKLTLVKVQRALSNIPTYMTFDDHEITDDWFITYDWSNNVLSQNLSKRIVQNGMSAYAICQDWGNSPENYQIGQPGGSLLSYFETIALNNNTGNSTLWDTSIGAIVLPSLSTTPSPKRLIHLNGGLNYHWHYQADNFEVIGLDSRTMRVYRQGDNKYPGLISSDAVDAQIKNLPGPLKDITFLITGAPVFGVHSIEKNIKTFGKHIYGVTGADMESWNLDEYSRQTLLSALSSRSKVGLNGERRHKIIILSGDVHYAFTNKVTYTANQTFKYNFSDVELLIIQCCASSFKNQTVGFGLTTTSSQHKKELDSINDEPRIWGFNNHNGTNSVQVSGFSINGHPTVQKFSDSNPIIIHRDDLIGILNPTFSLAPNWIINQIPLKSGDLRSHANTFQTSPGNSLEKYLEVSSDNELNYTMERNGGRYIVGLNTMGDIGIFLHSTNAGETIQAINHRLWWRNYLSHSNSGDIGGFPLTVHGSIFEF
jgi:hypothetical protein